MELKRLSYKHKNSKIKYYGKNYLRQLIPLSFYQKKLQKKLNSINDLSSDEIEEINARVNYYNKLETPFNLSEEAKRFDDLELKKGSKEYFFDVYEYGRYFTQSLKAHFLFGDITEIYKEPAFVKSRPVSDNNQNSILLKWNKVRHFMFVKKDKIPFSKKKDILISRGQIFKSQPHRIRFLEMYFNHPMCDIGMVNTHHVIDKWKVNRMTISEKLHYKFILCLEGNDVASNLKWVMSSGSLAVMPKAKFETWFMEGTLVPDYHYVAIKEDYSDLEEKLQFYIDNPDKAQEIVKNANAYVQKFKNKKREDLISILVLNKYFEKTNQL
ncbi:MULTISPECIES: glycosyl transferase family 90 [unclassified Cellulophaga]|uniref:glycosyl transferase family 90 n=1 Tax=unclassified Cellulophaga TaxID=2634405 RepID=UPI0026E3CE88|nr:MULTISPECIES: glycosyl transferase family 90 [unclassified Cellulophaga]MDO6493047.1 glycosyl transferase family 90 [Cellulophaga sp. 2_MG-2023]MDO6496023.1 glycosyl transferase family 90 [Cellulophaga sp. 3_MG-2023]